LKMKWMRDSKKTMGNDVFASSEILTRLIELLSVPDISGLQNGWPSKWCLFRWSRQRQRQLLSFYSTKRHPTSLDGHQSHPLHIHDFQSHIDGEKV
jgi:hypothetical protein